MGFLFQLESDPAAISCGRAILQSICSERSPRPPYCCGLQTGGLAFLARILALAHPLAGIDLRMAALEIEFEAERPAGRLLLTLLACFFL